MNNFFDKLCVSIFVMKCSMITRDKCDKSELIKIIDPQMFAKSKPKVMLS